MLGVSSPVGQAQLNAAEALAGQRVRQLPAVHPLRTIRRGYEGHLAWHLGILEAWRYLGPARRSVVIVNYHAVEANSFAQQAQWFVERYRVVPLAEAVEYARCGRPRGDHRVVLTFDDADESFGRVAYPVLVRWGLPATVYAIAGLMGQVPFWERLNAAFAREAVGVLNWAGRLWDCQTPRAAARTRKAILHALKRMTDPVGREALTDELVARLDELSATETVMTARPSRLMTWAELAGLDRRLINVGGHTVWHPSLGGDDPGVLAREIAGCRRWITSQLEREVTDFCYPYGRRGDVGRAAVRAVEEAGFRSAVTSQTGLCHVGCNPWRIGRVGLSGREPQPTWSARVSGWSATVRGHG